MILGDWTMEQPQYPMRGEPYLVPTAAGMNPKRSESHLTDITLGDLGIAVEVCGPKSGAGRPDEESMPSATLFLPFSDEEMTGIDAATVRMFRVEGSNRPRPVWDSGVNVELGFAWARIRRPGKYVPIGLPRDRLLQQILREIARARRLAGEDAPQDEVQAIAKRALSVFTDPPAEVVDELREFLTRVEVQTGPGVEQLRPYEIRLRQGDHLAPFPLPQDQTLREFRVRLKRVVDTALTLPGGLPEEALFYPPDPFPDVPWHRPGVQRPGDDIDWRPAERLRIWEYVDLSVVLPYLFPRDWWMYQHDLRHTGAASGLSGIRCTSVNRMKLNAKVPVEGPIITKPVVVDGKVYVGSGRRNSGAGGILFKIDLETGDIEGRFPTSGYAHFATFQGIGGSPAVVGGRVYFTGVHGKVYCVDAATMTNPSPCTARLWETDLKYPSAAQNQPIHQPEGDSWSSPLVVNGKVYIGCGEGEAPNTYGFVFCLDADTGRVLWLFCTCKFINRLGPGSENLPNVIPASVAVSKPLPAWAKAAGFSLYDDSDHCTRETGCSVWSSCAYDRVLNRIYVGTGNSQKREGEPGGGTDLPDEWYGSGLLSLDADTGRFCHFFQPNPCDSYHPLGGAHPTDRDVDVSGAPTIFSHNGERVVAFGSKNGSFFLLDPRTFKVIQRRQLLPRAGGSGLPDDPGTPIYDVAPTGPYGYNHWGIYATPAVHTGTGKLFVCLGRAPMSKKYNPFVRALDWNTLRDAWPTAVGPDDDVSRYTAASPPLYQSTEAGLSSPAVVNDVVFVSTNKTALYALDVHDGTCLWAALDLGGEFALGPAIYGDYVVMGAGKNVYIYVLGPRWARIRQDHFVAVPPASSPCQEPPWEGPDLRRLGKAHWKKET